MRKEIVLFIPSIERGGVEKNFFLISKYLVKKFKKIIIITANTDYKNKFDKNIIVICPNSLLWSTKIRLLKTIISLFLLLKNFFNKNILILSFQSNVPLILVSKLFNFRIIIRLNTSTKKYIKGTFKKLFYKIIYSFADQIIVNSLYFKKELKKYLKLNSQLIYNPFQSSNKKENLNFFKNFKGLKILTIGRLTDQKDQITLLKSLNLLMKNKLNFRCCIIGSGYKKKYLKSYIIDNKLNRFVKLLGYKYNAENYLNTCNLFVLTSKFEGLPNVLIEAQSKNIPIISSNCPTGPKEILLNGKLGDLFNVGDYKKLHFLILKFSKNKKILLNKAKKKKISLERFDYKKNCEKYCSIISNYR